MEFDFYYPADDAEVAYRGAPWSAYADGYRDSILPMLNEAAKHQRADGSIHSPIVFPVMYGIRHCIELRLKAIGAEWSRHGWDGLTGVDWELPRNHSLLNIWIRVKPVIEERYATDMAHDPGPVNEADEDIRFLDGLDPDGTVFRYPVNLRGALHAALQSNAPRLAEVLDHFPRVEQFLKQLEGGIESPESYY